MKNNFPIFLKRETMKNYRLQKYFVHNFIKLCKMNYNDLLRTIIYISIRGFPLFFVVHNFIKLCKMKYNLRQFLQKQ